MNEQEIRAKVHCCACGGALGKRLNMMDMGLKATWEFPTVGNVVTGAQGGAVAILCDGCIRRGKKPVEVVEFRGGEVVYHPTAELEKA